MQRLRHEALAGAVLAGDEDVGVGWPDAIDHLQDGAHRGRLGDQRGAALGGRACLRFEAPGPAQRPSELHLRPQDGEQPIVVPRLFDEVAGAPAHRFDSDVHRPPRRHDDDRQDGIAGVDLPQQLEAFLARRRVARVVEVDQHHVVVTLAERRERRRRRLDGVDLITLSLEQQPQGFEDIALIVGDEDAWGSGRHDAKLSLSREVWLWALGSGRTGTGLGLWRLWALAPGLSAWALGSGARPMGSIGHHWFAIMSSHTDRADSRERWTP